MFKVRPEVQEFAEMIERKIRQHQPAKGDSWKDMTVGALENRILDEIEELFEEKIVGMKAREAIDVATMSFFLWANYRAGRIM